MQTKDQIDSGAMVTTVSQAFDKKLETKPYKITQLMINTQLQLKGLLDFLINPSEGLNLRNKTPNPTVNDALVWMVFSSV